MEKNPITPEGHDKLREELHHLRSVERPRVIQMIATAREHGDLKENAEYHSAKEKLGEVMTRIAKINDKLQSAKLIDDIKVPNGVVSIGGSVTIKDEDGDEMTYVLLGEDESNPAEGRLSVYSPLAQGLLGKKQGEKVTIELPAGPREFKVIKAGPAA